MTAHLSFAYFDSSIFLYIKYEVIAIIFDPLEKKLHKQLNNVNFMVSSGISSRKLITNWFKFFFFSIQLHRIQVKL